MSNIGKIVFSKRKNIKADYYVDDPSDRVNKFFASKLERFGFVDIDSVLMDKLFEGDKISLSEFPVEYQKALSGNRLGNFEYHMPAITSTLINGGTVWISSQLLPGILESRKKGELSELEGVELTILEKVSPEPKFNLEDESKSISALVGLFGKFYNKSMSKKESQAFGRIQDDLLLETSPFSTEDVLTALTVVDTLYTQELLSKDIPPLNIFNKVKESLQRLL